MNTPKFTLNLKNLNELANEDYLTKTFSKFGAIKNVRIKRDPVSKKHLEECFINFTNSRDARAAYDDVVINKYSFGKKACLPYLLDFDPIYSTSKPNNSPQTSPHYEGYQTSPFSSISDSWSPYCSPGVSPKSNEYDELRGAGRGYKHSKSYSLPTTTSALPAQTSFYNNQPRNRNSAGQLSGNVGYSYQPPSASRNYATPSFTPRNNTKEKKTSLPAKKIPLLTFDFLNSRISKKMERYLSNNQYSLANNNNYLRLINEISKSVTMQLLEYSKNMQNGKLHLNELFNMKLSTEMQNQNFPTPTNDFEFVKQITNALGEFAKKYSALKERVFDLRNKLEATSLKSTLTISDLESKLENLKRVAFDGNDNKNSVKPKKSFFFEDDKEYDVSKIKNMKQLENVMEKYHEMSNRYKEEQRIKMREFDDKTSKWNMSIQKKMFELTHQLNKQKEEEEEERKICGICYEREKNVVFDCGHSYCGVCSEKIGNTCSFCRKVCKNKVRLYN